jgi:hypothetical protein
VLVAFSSGRQLDPVDAEGLDAELTANEVEAAAGAAAFDLVQVHD